jgi:hypothetical protein
MNDAPETIWRWSVQNCGGFIEYSDLPVISEHSTEYTRTDISQARITELEAALYKVLVARTYDTIFDETEIWELEDIAREALKDTTNE